MGKFKKLLISIYIVVIVAFSTIILNKIFATGDVGEIVPSSGTTNYGTYKLEVLDPGTITTKVGSIPSGSPSSWSYDSIIGLLELKSFDWVFCIDESVTLPYKDEQNVIYKYVEGAQPRDYQVAEHDFPDSTRCKNWNNGCY